MHTPKTAEVVVSQEKPSRLELKYRRQGSIVGFVEDASNDALLSGVVLRLSDDARNPVGAAQSDDAGVFRFPGLRPGIYTLTLELPRGYASDDVEQCILVASGEEVEVEFLVRMAGVVRGRIIDEETQEPLGDVAVGLYDSRGELVKTGLTSPQGEYEFINLPDDKYTVEIED